MRWGGGGGSADETFSLAPSAPIHLDQKVSSAPPKPQHHRKGGLPQPRWAVCAAGAGAHQGQTSREGEKDMWWTARTARGGAGHLGLTETQRGRLWTTCGKSCVDSKNSQTTPATTSTSSIRQLLGAADAQTAHHATFSTAPGTPTTGLRERGNDTSRSTGRSGRQNAAPRRNMRREERVTVEGPVKEQQPDGMSHGGGMDPCPPPPLKSSPAHPPPLRPEPSWHPPPHPRGPGEPQDRAGR